eukprot:m.195595 g.195595  ORF g.195595 m.195595 type:complete len:70 (-) comp19543_c0_seq1:1750-1959(-)
MEYDMCVYTQRCYVFIHESAFLSPTQITSRWDIPLSNTEYDTSSTMSYVASRYVSAPPTTDGLCWPTRE